ncbi:MAG: hypothetical protein P8127_01765 [Acidobacteriota bacterium]
MWPRCVVVSVLFVTSLVAPLSARAETALTVVSGTGSGFELKSSVTVDGGENGDDQARGISVAADGTVYATGYVTVTGQGRNIWLGKYSADLVYQDSVRLNGAANGDDEGYTMAFDPSGNVYLVGYMTTTGQGHDIWLGKFDSDLGLVDSIIVTGPSGDDDDGYGILYDGVSGNLYLAGTVRETGQGANIWLAIYDTDLDLVKEITMDGPVSDTDKARFLTFDDTRHLFVSGSMTDDLSRDYAIWLGKFEDDLTFVDEVTVDGPTTDEDKGYGLVFDGTDTIFLTGTMIETDESYNIWMAKLDTDLNILDQLTINGPADGEDVAYVMELGPSGRLYQTGTYTETTGGTNIWLARFGPSINLEAWVTLDGPAGGYDTGIGVAVGNNNDLYVSAIISDPVEDFNMWFGRFDISTIFVDGFESGSTGDWSSANQ